MPQKPDRDERFTIPLDDPEAAVRALLQVDPESEPVLTDEEVEKLTRATDDD